MADELRELRLAAAKASGAKKLEALIPALIRRLKDPEAEVAAAIHESLKTISGQNFDRDPMAWEKWWKERGKR